MIAKSFLNSFKEASETLGLRCTGGAESILYFTDEKGECYKLWFQNGVVKFCCTTKDLEI